MAYLFLGVGGVAGLEGFYTPWYFQRHCFLPKKYQNLKCIFWVGFRNVCAGRFSGKILEFRQDAPVVNRVGYTLLTMLFLCC